MSSSTPVTILTGPAAAGKNTIAQIYAAQFSDHCAVVDVDLVRAMLRHPHRAPWDGPEGMNQHRLGVKHGCMLAKSFTDEGFEVVVLDVVWADLGQFYREQLKDHYTRIVRLLPSWDETLRRLHARPYSITDIEAKWVFDTQQALQNFDYDLDNTALPADAVAKWLSTLPKSHSVSSRNNADISA